MKHIFIGLLFTFISLSLPTFAQARLDSNLKECVQRGHQFLVKSDQTKYCVFPDGSECAVEKFNTGECGAGYLTKQYCVKQGHYVWDADRCCKDLAYTEHSDMQATCEPFVSTQTMLTRLLLLISQLTIGGWFFYKIQKQSTRHRS